MLLSPVECGGLHIYNTHAPELVKATMFFASLADQKRLVIDLYGDEEQRDQPEIREGLPSTARFFLGDRHIHGFDPVQGLTLQKAKMYQPQIALKMAEAAGDDESVAQLKNWLFGKHDFGIYDKVPADQPFVENFKSWRSSLENWASSEEVSDEQAADPPRVPGTASVPLADLLTPGPARKWDDMVEDAFDSVINPPLPSTLLQNDADQSQQ